MVFVSPVLILAMHVLEMNLDIGCSVLYSCGCRPPYFSLPNDYVLVCDQGGRYRTKIPLASYDFHDSLAPFSNLLSSYRPVTYL